MARLKKIFHGQVLTGFAGSVADAFTLTEKFESKLEEHDGNLRRAAVDLAQMWRSDKGMRSLEALMIVMDHNDILVLSGNGEIIENFEVVYFENREAFGRKNKRNGKKRENRSLIVANPYKNCCKTLAKKYKLLYYIIEIIRRGGATCNKLWKNIFLQ